MVGKFITFEGIDGCGKTTQLERLAQWLPTQWQQWSQPPLGLVVTKEPGATPLGGVLRKLLLTPDPDVLPDPMAPTAELLLYAADRAQHVAQQLRPALEQGYWVLCDRYEDSTWAYQGLGRGLDLAVIEQLNAIATGGLHSDLCLWLDLDPAETAQRLSDRGGTDRMEQSGTSFHQRVRQGFAQLAQHYPQRIVRIDAQGDETCVAQRIQQAVTDWMAQAGLSNL